MVTGATGRVGHHVVLGLMERGHEVRALVRDRADARLPDAVELVSGDMRDPAGFAQNLDGTDALFLLWPFLSAEGTEELIQALAGRTGRIVYLSAEAAAHRPSSFWALVELAIERHTDDWTFLRPTGFAANTLMWADQIRTSGVVRWIYGKAARSLIDERDIAAVAVQALTEDEHRGARYTLTGPQALTQVEQVREIGKAIGRTLRWDEISRKQMAQQLTGIPETALDTWASFVDRPEIVTKTVVSITHRPARHFREWAGNHADRFR
jgi:uncharacterized protein YbjT (DUF2867 family)